MKNGFFTILCLVSFIAALDVNKGVGSKPLPTKQQEILKDSDQYFNILSLDGAGMNGLVIAQVLSLIEQYAYNYTEKKNIQNHAPVYGNQKLIPIKDMFNMSAATSVTSFLAVGLSIPSSENKTLPAYTAQNMVRLYEMKHQELDRYYHYRPNQILLMIIIFFLSFLIFYWIGINKFNHVNIDKAYVIIGEFIKRDIKEAEKAQMKDSENNQGQQDRESNSSYYEDKKNLDKKLKKRVQEEKKLEMLKKQIEGKPDEKKLQKLNEKKKECEKNIEKIHLKNYIYTKQQLVINNKNYDKFLFPNQGQSLDNDLVESLLEKKKDLIMVKCLTLIYEGKNINDKLDQGKEGDLEILEEAQRMLLKSIHKYKSRKPMVWVVTFTGLICVWYFINIVIPTLNSNYNFVLGEFGHTFSNSIGFSFSYLNKNKHLDTFMTDIYADDTFDDILQDELLVESFEYESKKPRMFSKWFQKNSVNQTNYNFKLRDAIAASISCPDYYEPYHKDNTIFMDMMLAQAKNPAMNAYIMAKHLINNGKNKKIRMLSISANDRDLSKSKFDPSKYFRSPKYDYMVQPDSIITDTLMRQNLGKDYQRISFTRPDNNVDKDIKRLEKEAKEFYYNNTHLIEPMIQQIIDERYNPKFKTTSGDKKTAAAKLAEQNEAVKNK